MPERKYLDFCFCIDEFEFFWFAESIFAETFHTCWTRQKSTLTQKLGGNARRKSYFFSWLLCISRSTGSHTHTPPPPGMSRSLEGWPRPAMQTTPPLSSILSPLLPSPLKCDEFSENWLVRGLFIFKVGVCREGEGEGVEVGASTFHDFSRDTFATLGLHR